MLKEKKKVWVLTTNEDQGVSVLQGFAMIAFKVKHISKRQSQQFSYCQ